MDSSCRHRAGLLYGSCKYSWVGVLGRWRPGTPQAVVAPLLAYCHDCCHPTLTVAASAYLASHKGVHPLIAPAGVHPLIAPAHQT